MRRIDTIIIHCSATKRGADYGAADIEQWHRQRGFRSIGYHYVVRLDGTVEAGRPIEQTGAHCKGWNATSIGICYIGGLDENGKPADTRTPEQKKALKALVGDLKRKYGIRQIIGHRDTSPDRDGDGMVEPEEYIKACPCFDVKRWLQECSWVLLAATCLLTACGSHKSIRKEENITQTALLTSDSTDSCQENSTETQQEKRSADRLEQAVFTFRQDSLTRKPLLTSITYTRNYRIQELSQKRQRQKNTRTTQNQQKQARQATSQVQQQDKKFLSVAWKWMSAITLLLLLVYMGKRLFL